MDPDQTIRTNPMSWFVGRCRICSLGAGARDFRPCSRYRTSAHVALMQPDGLLSPVAAPAQADDVADVVDIDAALRALHVATVHLDQVQESAATRALVLVREAAAVLGES